MSKLLLLLIFLFNLSYSQSENELYSNIISNNLNKEKKAIIIKKLIKEIDDNNMIFDPETESITEYDLFYIYNTEIKQRFRKDNNLKKVVLNINKINDKKSNRMSENLKIKNIEIKYITKRKFKSFFKSIFRSKNISKSWERIEKKYNSRKIFEFSKISYLGNYASFYYSIHCGGLCGSGSIVIFEKINGKWKLLTEMNIWNA